MSCRWFLVRTQPRREATAVEHLTRQGAEAYLPKFREAGKLTLLFPSYLFVHCCQISYSWIGNTLGVSNLVRMGADPVHVPQSLIDGIQKLEADLSTDPVDRSFQQGQWVRILRGPFAGLSTIFECALPGERVAVLMTILGDSTRVECNMRDVVAA